MEPRDLRGSTGFKGRLFFARPGDVIYSKIDVRNGAIGVVSDEIGTAAVSSEYPVYRIKPETALPQYIRLLFRTSFFRDAINSMISGASGRKRVQPSQLEQIEIPLPPLALQRAIVGRWRAAQEAVAAAGERITRIERETQARFLADLGLTLPERATPPKAFALKWQDLERWGVAPNQLAATSIDIHKAKYPVISGRDFLSEIKHGCSASPSSKPTALKVLKISAVTKGFLNLGEWKYMHDKQRYRDDFGVLPGDVLLCRTNGTLSMVGMSALVEDDVPDTIFPDKVIRLRCKETIRPSFLCKALQMPFCRSQIEASARTAVGNYAIGTSDLWALRLPLPPLSVQRAIMERVEAGRAEIAREREAAERLRCETQADVEAMILGAKPVETQS